MMLKVNIATVISGEAADLFLAEAAGLFFRQGLPVFFFEILLLFLRKNGMIKQIDLSSRKGAK